MKKYLLVIVLIAIVAGGIYQYMRINTYSYHLDKAEVALTRIEELIHGKVPTAFIPTAYAQDGIVDESAVAANAETAVDEIGMAQDIVNDMSDSSAQSEAQSEVNEIAEHASETLDSASEAVEGGGSKAVISDVQQELANLEADRRNRSYDTVSDDSYDSNNDPNMIADGSVEDDDEDDDEEEDSDDEIENEKPIDEAQLDDKEDNESDQKSEADYDADYAAAEKEALERYQPWLDWKGDTPPPAETDKEVLGDTAEVVADDGSQEVMQAEVEEGLDDSFGSSFDADAMKEAIDQMSQ